MVREYHIAWKSLSSGKCSLLLSLFELPNLSHERCVKSAIVVFWVLTSEHHVHMFKCGELGYRSAKYPERAFLHTHLVDHEDKWDDNRMYEDNENPINGFLWWWLSSGGAWDSAITTEGVPEVTLEEDARANILVTHRVQMTPASYQVWWMVED